MSAFERVTWKLYASPASRECGPVAAEQRDVLQVTPADIQPLETLAVAEPARCGPALEALGLGATPEPCADLREHLRTSVFADPPDEGTRATVCSAFGMDGGVLPVKHVPCYYEELEPVAWLELEACGDAGLRSLEQVRVIKIATLCAGIVVLAALVVWVLRRRRRRAS